MRRTRFVAPRSATNRVPRAFGSEDANRVFRAPPRIAPLGGRGFRGRDSWHLVPPRTESPGGGSGLGFEGRDSWSREPPRIAPRKGSGSEDAISGTVFSHESRPRREGSEGAISGTLFRHESSLRGLGFRGGGGGLLRVFGFEGRDSWRRVPPRIASLEVSSPRTRFVAPGSATNRVLGGRGFRGRDSWHLVPP